MDSLGASERVPTQRILIIEDEENLAEALRYTLEREGYSANAVNNGRAGLETARASRPDLVILDLMLPDLDGMSICKTLRQESDVPLLMLTARSLEEERVAGLDAGADDYVTKPFGMRELIARVRAMLRRQTAAPEQSPLQAGDLKVDLLSHNTWRGEERLELTRREFNLLALFVQNIGRAFSRDEILTQLWGEEWIGDVRTVDVHVRWLREKIEETPGHPKRLTTIRGYGYRFDG